MIESFSDKLASIGQWSSLYSVIKNKRQKGVRIILGTQKAPNKNVDYHELIWGTGMVVVEMLGK